MAVTASNASFDVPEFRSGKKASWITSTTGLLTKGATAEDDHYLRTPLNALTLIHPRPFSELDALTGVSIWTHWTPDAPYYAYPSAFGGCFPYRWTLHGAPSGMTINSDLDFTSFATRSAHGRITWPTPTAGTYTFTVRCTDQEGATVSRSVTLNVATSNAIFVSPSGTDSAVAAGTLASPFQKIDNWYANTSGTLDPADTRHAAKIVIYRAGTYTVPEDTGLGNLNMGANKPRVHVAYYGETVELDCSNAAYRWANSNGAGAQEGCEMLGLTFAGEDEVEMGNTFQLAVNDSNVIICDHHIKDFKYHGTSGSDNPAGIYGRDAGSSALSFYYQLRNIRISGLGSSGQLTGNGCAIVLFGLNNYELNNIYLESQASQVFSVIHLKHEHQNGVTRLLELPGASAGGSCGVLALGDSSDPSDNNEIEYSYIEAVAGPAVNFSDNVASAGNFLCPMGDLTIRRCTIKTGQIRFWGSDSGNATTGGHVFDRASGSGYNESATWANDTAETVTYSPTDVTGNGITSAGLLTGAERTAYLGTKGWEIV